MTVTDTALYQRLGGCEAVSDVVDELYARVADDRYLAKLFDGVDIVRQRRMLTAFVSQATGGSASYRGRDVFAAHAEVPVTKALMRRFVDHLIDAMEQLDVPSELAEEVVAAVRPIASAIVTAGAKSKRAASPSKSAAQPTRPTPTSTNNTGDASASTGRRRRAKADDTITEENHHMSSTNGRSATIDKTPSLLDEVSGVLAILEKEQANVLVADTGLNLVYVNEMGLATLRVLEPKLVEAFGIPVDEFLGGSIHRFHKDPSKVEARLANSQFPIDVPFTFSDRTVSTHINQIADGGGELLGYVVIFEDATETNADLADLRGQRDAIDKAQAVIEFELDGTIITANENFCATMGYELDEIVGQHHRMFVDPAYAASPEYAAFWEKLGSGVYDTAEYKRFGKGGKEIWIQASYNPIFDQVGRPFKVVKYATDITETKQRAADLAGQLEAIDKAQAVIEFELDGTIVQANDNFCAALGYRLDEIVGQHHRIFVDPAYAASPEYAAFWEKLGSGEYDTGEYRRITKSGEDIWIQASYNPILDVEGRPSKVVKFASDVTEQVLAKQRLEQGVAAILEVVTAAAQGDLTGQNSTSTATTRSVRWASAWPSCCPTSGRASRRSATTPRRWPPRPRSCRSSPSRWVPTRPRRRARSVS